MLLNELLVCVWLQYQTLPVRCQQSSAGLLIAVSFIHLTRIHTAKEENGTKAYLLL